MLFPFLDLVSEKPYPFLFPRAYARAMQTFYLHAVTFASVVLLLSWIGMNFKTSFFTANLFFVADDIQCFSHCFLFSKYTASAQVVETSVTKQQ